MSAPEASRSLRVPVLSRVEGEGGFSVRVKDGRVEKAELKIFEPPRLFEGFLRGRSYTEPPDLTARICGICPAAHQLTAAAAIEAACGVRVGGPLADLRRLLLCGEWIESHVLSIALLQAPDLLGYESGFAMARDHAPLVERALRLKKTGNALVAAVGGREVHPVNVRVGGFWKLPTRRQLQPLAEELRRAEDDARALLADVAGIPVPEHEVPHVFLALRADEGYPLCGGRLVSSEEAMEAGDAAAGAALLEMEDRIVREHVRRSSALHDRHRGADSTLVGPLARYSLNFDRLPAPVREAARDAGLGPVCRNPFRGIVVRAVETLWAAGEALRILESWEAPGAPALRVLPKAGRGAALCEAPRGILYHRYTLDAKGDVLDARIVPPTAQNLRAIERDLVDVVEKSLHLPDDRLTRRCEETIRNYDPCISCATHFLKLDVNRA